MTLALLSLLAVVVLCGAFYSCGRLEACKRRPPGQVTQRHLLYAASKALAAFLAARSAVTIARRVARCLSGWAGTGVWRLFHRAVRYQPGRGGMVADGLAIR
jgi:hypothetical protein